MKIVMLVLNRVYNTLHNQSTTTNVRPFCSCRLRIHENSNISILNRVYNTLYNQSTTIKNV